MLLPADHNNNHTHTQDDVCQQHIRMRLSPRIIFCTRGQCVLQHIATRCNTLQHAATQETKSLKNILYWRAVCCNTLQHTATHCNTLQHTATHCNALQHTATHCNTLQLTPNTLQHTATRETKSSKNILYPSVSGVPLTTGLKSA